MNRNSNEQLPCIAGRSIDEQPQYSEVAVLIPCFNEEPTLGKVVADFRHALPGAKILVFDNNSTDKTAIIARKMGAVVISAPRQGKGNVVRQMFDEVDARIYLMVDGDDTYPAFSAPALITEFERTGAHMLVGERITSFKKGSFRRFHLFGNKLVAILISCLFSTRVTDVLSGYRVLSRDFVKCISIRSTGFEVETEIMLQALAKNFLVKEMAIQYGERPKGSYSKLNTFSDGILILKAIFMIFKDYKPFTFFALLSAMLFLVTVLAGIWPILDYMNFRYVYHVPLAILASGTAILSALSLSIGLILDTISRYQNENFDLLRRLLARSDGPLDIPR